MMVKEVHKIVRESEGRRVIIANSATSIDETNKDDIVVDGSHFGLNVGEMAKKAGVIGMIGNDAGVGIDKAGIAGLKFLENYGIPAAAVSCMSAEIGNGTSTYEEGKISIANEVAKRLGITVGMSAKEATDKMFASESSGGGQKIIRQSGKIKLIIVDTSSDVHAENCTDIIITGSHSGQNSGEHLSALKIKGVISNDGGIGKNSAGIAGLKILAANGIPAATVSSMSAHIGNGTSTYEKGVISAVNETAERLGIVVGMPARKAANRMFETVSKPDM